MDTLPLEPIELVAIDAARNIRRRWSIVASVDLFGHVLVERHWGRIGTRGQATVHSFPDPTHALRHVRALLARRRSAPRRLGVRYRPHDPDRRHACDTIPTCRVLYLSGMRPL